MINKLDNKTLLIAVVENEKGEILMRKKPDGSLPYKETWYLFGCDQVPGKDDTETLAEYLKNNIGIDVISMVLVGTDEEVKPDHDEIVKKFTYLDYYVHLQKRRA